MVAGEARHWNVLSICDSAECSSPRFAGALNLEQLFFDDILADLPRPGFWAARPRHLRQALRFFRHLGPAPLLIHCRAGISRSTALAWVLVYDKLRHSDRADAVSQAYRIVQAIRPGLAPNPHVLQVGIDCLATHPEQRQRMVTQFKACLPKRPANCLW